jgi:RHS repeat-associated protein
VDAKGAKHQTTNYYAFGMTNEESSSTWQSYKYNGKELDRMHGLNTYDYGARQHDPILARWDRMDPLCEKYYSTSPYACCGNNPIIFLNPDGRRIEFAKGVSQAFKDIFAKAIQCLKENKCDGIFAKLQASPKTIYIGEATAEQKASHGACFTPDDMTIHWDSTVGMLTTEYHAISPTVILNHEGDHALKYVTDSKAFWNDYNTPDEQYSNKLEKDCIQGTEQTTARALGEIKEGEVTRTDHKAVQVLSTPDPTKIKAPMSIIEDLVVTEEK